MISRRELWLLLLLAWLLPACAVVRPAGVLPTVKIGLVAPFEGLHRQLGYEALFGVKLALQERNAAGGIQGYRVELVALNDFDDPTEAAVQARALVADPQVIGVVGHLSEAATLAALPVYRQAGLAVSVPWPVGSFEPAAAGGGVVTVAASEAETQARLAEAGQAMGLSPIFELSEPDLIPADAQALELAGETVAAAERVVRLRRAGVSLPLLGQVNVGSPLLLQVAGTEAAGLIFVSPGPAPRDVPGGEAFAAAYQNLAGFPPGPRAVLAYDGTQVLLDALNAALAAGPPTRAGVSAALAHVERRGLSGPITFGPHGQRIDAPIWIYQMSDEYPGKLAIP